MKGIKKRNFRQSARNNKAVQQRLSPIWWIRNFITFLFKKFSLHPHQNHLKLVTSWIDTCSFILMVDCKSSLMASFLEFSQYTSLQNGQWRKQWHIINYNYCTITFKMCTSCANRGGKHFPTESLILYKNDFVWPIKMKAIVFFYQTL